MKLLLQDKRLLREFLFRGHKAHTMDYYLIIIIFKLYILIYFCQCWPGPLFFDNITCYSNLMPFHYTKWLPRECENSVLQCTIPVWNGLLHNWYQHSPLVKEVSKEQWNSLGVCCNSFGNSWGIVLNIEVIQGKQRIHGFLLGKKSTVQ